MTDFIILYQFTDDDGMHRAALFPGTYQEAQAMMAAIVFSRGAHAKLYKLNDRNSNYDFLEEWIPEKHPTTRKETNNGVQI